jgi:hypothetical protein
MKIYTSYFANLTKLRNAGIVPIGISRFPPKWYNGDMDKRLAPTDSMLAAGKAHNWDREGQLYFYAEYDDILKQYRAKDLVQRWEILSGGKDFALVCFEKPSDSCHRHYLAKFLMDVLNIKIEEFGYPDNLGVCKPFSRFEAPAGIKEPLSLFD